MWLDYSKHWEVNLTVIKSTVIWVTHKLFIIPEANILVIFINQLIPFYVAIQQLGYLHLLNNLVVPSIWNYPFDILVVHSFCWLDTLEPHFNYLLDQFVVLYIYLFDFNQMQRMDQYWLKTLYSNLTWHLHLAKLSLIKSDFITRCFFY